MLTHGSSDPRARVGVISATSDARQLPPLVVTRTNWPPGGTVGLQISRSAGEHAHNAAARLLGVVTITQASAAVALTAFAYGTRRLILTDSRRTVANPEYHQNLQICCILAQSRIKVGLVG